jgi:putative oxidoreductase
MAVAYFVRWAPHGPLPITNGGELAVIFCFIYLWLVTAGSGAWSLDYLMRRDTLIQKRTAGRTIASWEVYARSVLRVILAFTFSLHGYRGLLGLFPAAAGRPGAVPMALDRLPALAGGLEIFAAALCVELLAAYLYSAAPRGIWPIGNGGEETLLYLLVFLCFAATGGGAWSVDYITGKTRRNPASTVPAL